MSSEILAYRNNSTTYHSQQYPDSVMRDDYTHAYTSINDNDDEDDYNYEYAYTNRPSLHKSQRSSRAPSNIAPIGNRAVVFSPRGHYWAAYDPNGKLVNSGRASGGKDYCPDIGRRCHTPSGVYRVYSKGGADCYSRKFPVGSGGAPMPYCMFFHGGYALHGSYQVPDYNASHGCVRLPPSDARWLSHNFVQYGTTVIVHSY